MKLSGFLCILCIFAGNSTCFKQSSEQNLNQLPDYDVQQCHSICVGAGAGANYDEKSGICRCTMNENVDDTQFELMMKNARDAKVHLILIEKLEDKKVEKRETDDHVGQRTPGFNLPRGRQTFPNFFSTTTTRRPLTHRRPTIRPGFPTARSSISRNAQQRMQEIQKRLNSLRSRTRNTPHLLQRANFDNPSTPTSNVLEQIRQRQKELQDRLRSRTVVNSTARTTGRNTNSSKHSGSILGSTQNLRKLPIHIKETTEKSSTKTTKAELSTNKKDTQSEIITQPPNLYSNEDN